MPQRRLACNKHGTSMVVLCWSARGNLPWPPVLPNSTRRGALRAYHGPGHPRLRIDGASAVKKITIEIYEVDIEDIKTNLEEDVQILQASQRAILTSPSEREIFKRKEAAIRRVMEQFEQGPK